MSLGVIGSSPTVEATPMLTVTCNCLLSKSKTRLSTVTLELDRKHHALAVAYIAEQPVWKPSYRLIFEGDHFSAAATASPLLPLLSLMPRSSAASRRRLDRKSVV